jgi:hypothetical protein
MQITNDLPRISQGTIVSQRLVDSQSAQVGNMVTGHFMSAFTRSETWFERPAHADH